MGTPAAICIDNDLTSGEPGISLRATNDKQSRRLDLRMVSICTGKALGNIRGRSSYHPDT